MKKILLFIGVVGIAACTHAPVLQVEHTIDESKTQARNVSSNKIHDTDAFELPNPQTGNGFVRLSVSAISDLEALKSLVIQSQQHEKELTVALKLNSDYFKSLKWSLKIIEQIKAENPPDLKASTSYLHLAMVLRALRARFDSPFDQKVEVLALPVTAVKYTYTATIDIPNDKRQAREIKISDAVVDEIKRKHILTSDSEICRYEKAKDGWGYKPGFKVMCGERKLKIKFGNETLSGPINSRIFRSLSYLTPKIDVIDDFKMKYDRRFITEFNSQKEVKIDVKLAGIKLKTISTKKKKDPFGYIKSVNLIGGEVINVDQFEQKLINGSGGYNEEFEKTIDFVTFVRASVTEPLEVVEVGPWSFDDGVYKSNPEVRAGVIVSAWVGNTDLHSNNNRLVIDKSKSKDNPEVLPIFIDVGYGLGRSDSALNQSSSDVQKMNWTISSRIHYAMQNNQFPKPPERVALSGFVSQHYNTLLKDLDFADLIRGLSKICGLTAEDIRTAFVESGADEKTTAMGVSKLLNRRNQLIEDLEVKSEFSACYERRK